MDKSCNFLIISLLSKNNSFGNYDLYISLREENNKWSEPINMGPSINSEDSETQPFFDNVNNILYFTSNGHSSIDNSSDIFYSKRLYDSWQVWSNPRSLGENFNTELDELFFSLSENQHGYLLKRDVYGKIDIYEFDTNDFGERLINRNSNHKYLSDVELKETIGLTQSECIIYFDSKKVELSNSNKELLWFIASRLKEQEEINMTISFSKKTSKSSVNLFEKRTQNILQYMQSLDISMNKMMINSNYDYTEYLVPAKEDGIILMFYTE